MKILQLIQKKQLRGAEVFASQISNHMAEAGHDVKLVSLVDGDAVLPFNGITETLNVDLSNKYFDLKGWRKLNDLVSRFKPDVVQANAGDTLKYAVFSRLFFRWKAKLVFRNASVISRYLGNPVAKQVTRFLVRRADHIASVSTVSAEDIQNEFSLSPNNVTVIPIGIENALIKKLPAFENGLKNIVHVGGFTFEKNHEGLVRIFEMCLKRNPQLHLWLVGSGPLLEKIKALVVSTGIIKDVSFAGHVGNPMDYIHSADLCILPSIIEGLPGVVAEAFYCGTPVVAYEVGGIADLVQNGKNGWLVSPGDESAFATRVIEVLDMEPRRREEISDAARLTVMENFRNTVIADRFIALYNRIKV